MRRSTPSTSEAGTIIFEYQEDSHLHVPAVTFILGAFILTFVYLRRLDDILESPETVERMFMRCALAWCVEIHMSTYIWSFP